MMKKYFYYIIALISSLKYTYADDIGLFGGSDLTKEEIRRGEIDIDDIPGIIKGVIDFGMGIAGTVAMIFIIVGAYQILFGSIEQDRSKGKNTIFMALMGFVIASLAWFIIRLIVDNFGG